MADQFYSLQNEESMSSYYNVQAQQQQQQLQSTGLSVSQQHPQTQQQQQSSLLPITQQQSTLSHVMANNVSMCDYNNNLNNNHSNNNNNRVSTLHYFGGTGIGSCGIGGSGGGINAGASMGNRTTMLSQSYGKIPVGLNGNHLYTGGYAMGTPGVDIHTSIIPTSSMACQYAHANGSASCYNRNRYMPYNHNRACAAAAMAAASGHPVMQHQQKAGASSIVATTAAAYNYQQFAPIYQQSALPTVAPPLQPPAPNVTATAAAALAVSSVCSIQSDYSFAALPSIGTTAASGATTTITSALLPSASSTVTNCKSNTAAAVAAVPTPMSLVTAADTVGAGLSTSFNHQPTMTTLHTVQPYATVTDPNDAVTLQITNLDYSLDESILRNFLLNQLKPITPVVSLVFEGNSYAKVTVPDLYFAKQVVSNLHRKKIGHKRMLVSYTRDSSLTEINTLRCQVAGLLKDVPYYTLPMYKFRELFQSRFKTSISVLDLYKMQDICTINSDNNEDKFISLQPELVNSLESSPLMEGLQHSVPYCTVHFKREQHKGWAEQDIEPLPNVCMTIAEIQKIIYPLLKHHPGDIPVATLVHCIEGELKMQIQANDIGVNLEHLVCCVQGIQIQVNNFGIKILGWLEQNKDGNNGGGGGGVLIGANINSNSNLSVSERNGCYGKNAVADPLYQISREVIELVKMSPKSTMKFNRFIPAYHNHFGKQCRVADYGYTKLIELFEALSTVVQIMGDGENRQITLTHRTQIRRFTSDLLRILRAHGNNSVLLSQLPSIFSQTQNRSFDVTDYGVCDIEDILDGLVNSNIVVISSVQNGKDILISIPKRKQTQAEVEKTCIFAGEMVELFRNALQYTILFQKFVRSYHYHFAYQCRLSDYGFLKLADLMEAIHGVVEMELTNDEDKKLYLSPLVARRVFAEQCEELTRDMTGSSMTSMKLEQVLKMHKKKYGYQMLPQTLDAKDINEAIELLPYVELTEKKDGIWIICHNEDPVFRTQCYCACKQLLAMEATTTSTNQSATKAPKDGSGENDGKKTATAAPFSVDFFITEFNAKHKNLLTKPALKAMKHAIEIFKDGDRQCVRVTNFTKFLVSIVRLLEQRPTMYLHEIKCALDCGISTTFDFGYPNLYTVIAAYPDLFALNVGPTQERSDVSLAPNCELRNAAPGLHKHLYGSLKMPFTKQKNVRSVRAPLGEHNGHLSATQAPPHKTRHIAQDYAGPTSAVVVPPSTMSGYMSKLANHYPSYIPVVSSNNKASPPYATANANTAHKHQSSINSSMYSSGSQHSSSGSSSCNNSSSCNLNTSASNLSLCNMSNKENSFNTSTHLFNSSFNSSSASNELNTSLGNNQMSLSTSTLHINPNAGNMLASANHHYALSSSTQLWDRRQSQFYQQQQQQQQQLKQQQPAMSNHMLGSLSGLMLPTQAAQATTLPRHPTLGSTGATDSTGLYDLVSSMPMCPIYEPPKPDTPPSENMPFWIDPIWTNNSSKTNNNRNLQTKNNLLNIRLPEIKALNVLPMLLSPYTISKNENMKQQVFNFDNHDRKIA